MKRILTFAAFLLVLSNAFAVGSHFSKVLDDNPEFAELQADIQKMNINEFLEMTPKKYKEKTGKKLGFFKSIQLKTAQKIVKKKLKKMDKMEQKASANIPLGVYILLAFFALGWLAMGLLDNWSGNSWWIALLLYVILWLPGFIFSLIKMGDYY